MQDKTCETFWVKLYLSGPIDVAKQVIRKECLVKGLCVTIEPTTYIYTGGEESGYVVGLVNYPRFPLDKSEIIIRAEALMRSLLDATFQNSAMMMTPDKTRWISNREI